MRRPAKVIKFAPKSEHASSVGGLAEWASVDEALQAVFLANHCTIDAPNDSPFPYNVKLIFSTVPISEQRAQRTRERVAQQQQQQQQQQRSDASNNGSTANNDGNNANAAESSALGSSDYSASKASRHWKVLEHCVHTAYSYITVYYTVLCMCSIHTVAEI